MGLVHFLSLTPPTLRRKGTAKMIDHTLLTPREAEIFNAAREEALLECQAIAENLMRDCASACAKHDASEKRLRAKQWSMGVGAQLVLSATRKCQKSPVPMTGMAELVNDYDLQHRLNNIAAEKAAA